jgi:DNA-binding beta-propeller fold protein YncE
MVRRKLAAVLAAVSLFLLPSLSFASPYLYVCDKLGKQLTVIDTATDGIVDMIDMPGEPHDIGFSPDGLHAYVSLYDIASAVAFDPTTKAISPKITGESVRPCLTRGAAITPCR